MSPCLGLLVLCVAAPAYLTHLGFPLDDAWIHAVYARSLAASGTLAYNPGIPAAGETSPLWAALCALFFAFGSSGAAYAIAVKVGGFALHVASVGVLQLALVRAGASTRWATAGAVLVGCHPDLLAASVSGMEVPLATLILAALVWSIATERGRVFGVVSGLAFLARPETAALAVLLPSFFVPSRAHRSNALRCLVWGAAGAGSSALLVLARNGWVTGRPLPSTFYAKVGVAGVPVGRALATGFFRLMPHLPIVGASFTLVALTALAGLLLPRGDRAQPRAPTQPLAQAMWLSGVAFCAISFVLVPPDDVGAFYHQRYVLPALPWMLAATPWLLAMGLARIGAGERPRAALGVACGALCIAELVLGPPRFRRLSNDARNIDEVQVALGRFLSRASGTTAWVVDAGAARFFGRAFVVDLIGLNTPQMLTAGRQRYLDAHPPRYLDVFSGWTQLDPSFASSARWFTFETREPYTVVNNDAMRRHRLAVCAPGQVGKIAVEGRVYPFRCEPPANPARAGD